MTSHVIEVDESLGSPFHTSLFQKLSTDSAAFTRVRPLEQDFQRHPQPESPSLDVTEYEVTCVCSLSTYRHHNRSIHLRSLLPKSSRSPTFVATLLTFCHKSTSMQSSRVHPLLHHAFWSTTSDDFCVSSFGPYPTDFILVDPGGFYNDDTW